MMSRVAGAVWALVPFSLIRVPYDFRKYPSQQTQSFIIHTKHNMGQNTAYLPQYLRFDGIFLSFGTINVFVTPDPSVGF